MAERNRNSIFGITPSQLKAQRQQEQQKTIMQQIQQAAPRSPTPAMTSLGIAIGAGLGKGLLSRFGGVDTEMQMAEENQRRKQEFDAQLRSIDTNTVEGAMAMANLQNQYGSPAVAVQFLQQADRIKKNQLEEEQRELQTTQAKQASEIIKNIPIDPTNPIAGLRRQYTALRSAGLTEEANAALDDIQAIQSGAKAGDRLSAGQEKEITRLQGEAESGLDLAAEMDNIADQYENLDPASGLAANVASALKDITGQQDAVTILRRRYNSVITGIGLANLPPGAASDKDVDLVFKGFLPDNARPDTVASFLRGLSKVAEYKAERARFTSNYIKDTGTRAGALSAWQETGKVESANIFDENTLKKQTELPKGYTVKQKETFFQRLNPFD